MLPACRTAGDGFAIPTFALTPGDVGGFIAELQEFQGLFHDCFPRSETRAHFFDYMVGQLRPLERKSIEPIALQVPGGNVRGLQRFLSDVVWDEEQMRWNYHQLVADEMGAPDGVLMFDETGFVKKGPGLCGGRAAILWDPGQGRELSGRRVRRLCLAPGLCPGGPAVVPPGGVVYRHVCRPPEEVQRSPGVDFSEQTPVGGNNVTGHRAGRPPAV